MRIGEAALASGATPRALRLYEEEGLIEPGRVANGYRDYCSGTLERVRLIRQLIDAGLPVRLVGRVLPALVEGRAVDTRTRQELDAYYARLVRRLAELDERRSSLATFLGRIDALGDGR